MACPASIGVADTRTTGYDAAALVAAADAGDVQGKRAPTEPVAAPRASVVDR